MSNENEEKIADQLVEPTAALEQELDQHRQIASTALQEKLSADIAAQLEAFALRLAEAEIDSTALKVGDTVPDFSLPNHRGSLVSLSDVVSQGPTILFFDRGTWCTYCKVVMNALQRVTSNFRKLSTSIVAILPQNPDRTSEFVAEAKLEYEVLTDLNCGVAEKFGLTYRVTDSVYNIWDKEYQLHLEKYFSSTPGLCLPIAAIYVVDSTRTVRFAHVHSDYSVRPKLSDLVACVENILGRKRTAESSHHLSVEAKTSHRHYNHGDRVLTPAEHAMLAASVAPSTPNSARAEEEPFECDHGDASTKKKKQKAKAFE